MLNDFNTKADNIRSDYEHKSDTWGSILYKVRMGLSICVLLLCHSCGMLA